MAAQGLTRSKQGATGPRRYVILIVDDEADTAESLREVLAAEPETDVMTARSGLDALEQLRSGPVDLVIVDYRMPNMNGLEFLLRMLDGAPRVDRIMLTAYADLHLAIRAINEGRVHRFFTKPVDPESLLAAVRGFRQERRSSGDRARAFSRGMDTLRRGRRRSHH